MRTAAESSVTITRRTWWGRNWKWAAPLLILLAVVIGGVIYAWPLISPRFHPRYAASLEELRKHPVVIEKLGNPIETVRPFPAGRILMEGDRGEANFNFDVSGPKGTAAISSKSRYMQGQWGFTQLEITFSNGERIDIASSIQDREGDDTPKFDPNIKLPEVKPPDLPKDISIDLPPGIEQQ